MAATLSPAPKLQFFDPNGNPLVGGKLYSYISGTTTPLATYTSSTGLTANPNPTILDARGEASVWLGASVYKLILKDMNDVQIWSVSGIESTAGAVSDLETRLAAVGGAAMIGFQQSGGSATTVQTKLRQNVNLMDFGADNTGVADCTTAIVNAIAAAKAGSGTLIVPKGKYKITTGGIALDDVTIQGCGTYEKRIPYDNGGSVFLLTSTTVSPFNLGCAVTLSGLTFFYPGQDGAAVSPVTYPALFVGTYVTAININNCTIVNAYIGFKFNTAAGAAVGDFRMSSCRVYCVNTVFHFLVGAPEIINLTDCLFSLGVYEEVSNVSPFYLRNYTAAAGRFMFVDVAGSAWGSIDGLTMSGCLVYGYRYGIAIQTGLLSVSNIANNKFDAVGTAFYVDTAGQAQSCNFTSNLFYCYSNADPSAANAGLLIVGTGSLTSVVLVGNEFSYCQGSAIVIDGTDVANEVQIVGNKFKSWGVNSSGAATEYFAISIHDVNPPLDCLISGNQFKGNGTKPSGIITGTLTGALIEGNYFISCYNPIAIGANSTNVRIYGNMTKDTVQANPLVVVTNVPGAVEANMNQWDKVPGRWAFPISKSVLSASQTFTGAKTAVVAAIGNELYDEDLNFNAATGTFTAPTRGYYTFNVSLTSDGTGTIADRWLMSVEQAGSLTYYSSSVETITTAGAIINWAVNSTFKMAAGDTIKVYMTRTNGTGNVVIANDANTNWFCARKVL